MPVCKNCHARLNRFDKDRCPICGTIDPFTGGNSDTVEVTGDLNFDKELLKSVKVKKKVIAMLLSILLPFFGTPFYYLCYAKRGLIWFVANILLLGSLFAIFYFLVFPKNLLWSIIVPLIATYSLNLILGLSLMFKSNYKDGRGELVK